MWSCWNSLQGGSRFPVSWSNMLSLWIFGASSIATVNISVNAVGCIMRQVKVPTLQEVAQIYNLADPIMKVWICCQKDSGLGTMDMLSLNLFDIKDQLDRGIIPIHIQIRHMMSWFLTNTFFGSNTIDALRIYLPNGNGKLFNIRQKIIQNRLRKLGLKTQMFTEDCPLTSYSLRKFFYVEMVNAGVAQEVIEHWMGHSQPDVTGLFGMPMKTMAEIYMRAYPHIDLSKACSVISN